MKTIIDGITLEGTPQEMVEYLTTYKNGTTFVQEQPRTLTSQEPVARSTFASWKAKPVKRKYVRHIKHNAKASKASGVLRHFNNWGKCAYYRKNAEGEWVFAAACNKMAHKHAKSAVKKANAGKVVVNGSGVDLRRLDFKTRARIKATNNDKYGKIGHSDDGRGYCRLSRVVRGAGHKKVYLGMCPIHGKKRRVKK